MSNTDKSTSDITQVSQREEATNTTVSKHNSTTNPRKPKTQVVKDDWEDDDDDDDIESETVWHDANTKAPMPKVILASRTTASTSSVVVPPPEALQAPMRILKRPKSTASPSQSSISSSSSVQKTLKDREAAYQAARDRIFGADRSQSGSPQRTTGPVVTSEVSTGGASIEGDRAATAPGGNSATRQSQGGHDSKEQSTAERIRSPNTQHQLIEKGVTVIRSPRGPTVAGSSGANTSIGFGKRTKQIQSSLDVAISSISPPHELPGTAKPSIGKE